MRYSRTQVNGKVMEIEIEGMKIEEVRKTKYLGTIVTKDNVTEEEIKESQPVIEPPSRTKRYSKGN